MAKKKILKVKEPVRIREKELSNGNKSLYLDIYQDGKRTYEFLKLYLVPEVDTNARLQNAETKKSANAIKAQRIIELANGKAGIKPKSNDAKMLLSDWLKIYQESQDKKGVKVVVPMYVIARVIEEYKGSKVRLLDVDKSFCKGFINYLRYEFKSQHGKPLKEVSISNYCTSLNCALNAAVRADIIPSNPFSKVDKTDKVKVPESPRCYLTMDEIQKLIDTPCYHPEIKEAFLFSVFSGLRISDIELLTWDKVVTDGEKTHLEIVIQKTSKPSNLPLSEDALLWMPDRGNKKGKDKVFELPHRNTINYVLEKWAEQAKITKHVTFHVARHTFATMMLTLDAKVEVVQTLMGHADIHTTQIYAKIVDKKKEEAVNLTNGIFKTKKKD